MKIQVKYLLKYGDTKSDLRYIEIDNAPITINDTTELRFSNYLVEGHTFFGGKWHISYSLGKERPLPYP